MPYCVFDTETSGLFDFSKPAHAPEQPRLASLSMIFVSDDLAAIMGERRFHVLPNGWEMTPDATRVNGLTTEFLLANGHPIGEVLDIYEGAIVGGYTFGAFNAQYDTKVMRGEFRRAGREDHFERTPNVCAMRAAAKVIPRQGRKGGSWMVSLANACEFFGIVNIAPHEASADAMACLEIMRALRRMGALPEAAIHYAKNRPV